MQRIGHMQKSLFERAYLDESHQEALPDCLTLPELARLRVSSLDGDGSPDAFTAALTRLERQAAIGVFQTETRVTPKWSGSYIKTETVEDGPLSARGTTREVIYTSNLEVKVMVRHMVDHSEEVITKAQARALFEADQAQWGDGARKWLSGGKVEAFDLQARLDATGVPMTADEAQALMVDVCKPDALVASLVDAGFNESKIKPAFGKKTSDFPWLGIARQARGKYYRPLVIRFFELMAPDKKQKPVEANRLSVVGGVKT